MKKVDKKRPRSGPFKAAKTLIAMKLTILFTLLGIIEASASAYSQIGRVSLSMENATIIEVLNHLEKITDYHFIYSLDLVAKKQQISIHAAREPLKEVLKKVLTSNGVGYEVMDNNLIVVTPARNDTASEIKTPGIVQQMQLRGTVTDNNGNALVGVTVVIKGTSIGTRTDEKGVFALAIPDKVTHPVLVFSYIGYLTQEVPVSGKTNINVVLKEDIKSLNQVVVVGYGTQKKESLTGAISSVTNADIERVHAATVSGMLAGKLPGLSFRQPDGRPGASAMLQIRNMGTPLFVIDGIQKDEGQFNNISPNDIESITILKDASAAIYGVRAANGVVVVTTKKGKTGSRNTVSVDAYYGWQNWSRFPRGVNAYNWMLGKADAEMNQFGNTNITPAELEKWKAGTTNGYKSFDWYDFIVGKNAPQRSVNISASGGSEKTNYYLSVTRLSQDAVFKDFNFNRTNMQSNVDTKIGNRLKLGVQINGRIETRQNPGVPGYDDYWQPRFALFRNRPTERPYANDNPKYPNNISNIETNWALLNYARTGFWKNDWRVLQTNFNGEYQFPIKGLTARGMYSYYFADNLVNTFEYTYDVFTYNPVDSTYKRTGGNDNPYRDRIQTKIFEKVLQGQLNYNNVFAGKHTVGATFVAERIERRTLSNFLHSVPKTNYLSLIQFADMDTYNDSDNEEARIGYVGRINYNYANKYYLEIAGRRDASWKFAADKRWGFFPSFSAGWRITEEHFFKSLIGRKVLSDLKIRASYGQLGDDNVGIGAFDYIPGYTYGSSTVILDGNIVRGSRDRGVPIKNISWFKSNITDIGIDYSLWDSKLTGSFDYFYRKRTGLRGRKYDVLVPSELGYSLPDENLNSDAQIGGEASLAYNNNIGGLQYRIGGNLSYSRSRFLSSYKPRWGNSWDHYRTSQEDRWSNIFWGYQVIGQFKSQEEINNYPVNIDGQGNKTLLPGDFIYKDVNGDGRIDGYDERPIGYGTGQLPIVNYGLNVSLSYKGIDFSMDFSGGTLYSYNQNWEMRWPFQNTGNLLASMYSDRWHRTDPFDLNSKWIPGKNPPLRFNNPQHSNYNKNSTWWLTNVTYLRMRTMELGYTLPQAWLNKMKIQKVRIYANTYNLFSIDNVRQFGIDPEIVDENGLQYPQNKFLNVGMNLTF